MSLCLSLCGEQSLACIMCSSRHSHLTTDRSATNMLYECAQGSTSSGLSHDTEVYKCSGLTHDTEIYKSSGLVNGTRAANTAMTCLSSNVVRSGSSIGLEVGINVRVTVLAGHLQLLLTLQ